MKCSEVIEVLGRLAPESCACDWDNPGLLAGRSDKEVKKIYIALDATDQVVEAAIKGGADMLLTHHPLIFKAIKKVNDQNFITRRLVKLIQADISYYAMHTNYDVLRMADLSADILGIDCQEVLDKTSTEEDKGIGKIGIYENEMTLRQCSELVKKKFGLNAVQVFGAEEKTVRKIAVCAGSGKSVISLAIDKGADVLITGDIGHHEGIDAVEQGLTIIDAGHYGLEHIFIKDVAETLEKDFSELVVKQAEIVFPFQVY